MTKVHRFLGYAIGAIAVGCLAVMAARAGSAMPGSTPWLVAADLLVGVVFVLAGALAPGSVTTRWLVAAVGISWLLGSWLPGAEPWHQAVLAVALTVFPAGRPSGALRWLLGCLAVPVLLGLVPQLGVAALFVAIAGTSFAEARGEPIARWYPTSSAAGMGLFLAGSWTLSRVGAEVFDPLLALLVYQIVLVVVAINFPIAATAMTAGRARLTDLVLGDEGLAGLDGLAKVLGDAVGDPELRVFRWGGSEAGHVTTSGKASQVGRADTRWLEVVDETGPVAVVEHLSPTLDDPSTAQSVAAAVRLAVRHLQLEEELQLQLEDLEAARLRIVAAVDRQQEVTANRLREDVVTPLRQATAELDAILPEVDDLEAAEALEVVIQELTAAEGEVAALVAGVPPAAMGNGHLHNAIVALAEFSPVPVTVTALPEAAADAETETALFYVCSEALTNAVKHAAAGAIDISLSADNQSVVLRVSDDGRGGADLSGSGLQGLADRMASRGGRLLVESPPGAGTTVTALLPR